MRFTSAVSSGAIFSVSSLLASAHVGPGLVYHDNGAKKLESRDYHMGRFMARARPSNAAQMAKVSDPTKECSYYGLPESTELSSAYPRDGTIATIVSGDEQAKQVWQEIQSSGVIPHGASPKAGTQDHMGLSPNALSQYDTNSDPDCWWSATRCTSPKKNKLSHDIVTCPEPSTWGLTFDDGPNCSHNAFYDFLKEKKIRASLFYIGLNVKNWPLQAQRGLADGHDICVHTWSHHYMTTLSDEQVFAELYYTMRIIKDVVGVTPQCWRPPFGDVDNRVRAIADGLGLRTIIWSDDTNDWNIKPSGELPKSKIDRNYEDIINKGRNGSGVVVLSHEIRADTMNEFMEMYPKIQQAYKHVVPLTACMNVSHPYAENNISYRSFAEYTSGNIRAKGLPSLKDMSVNPKSKLQITPVSKQKWGFSPSSK